MLTATDQDVIAKMHRFANATTDFDRRSFLGATGHIEDAHTMKPDDVWPTMTGVARAEVAELLGIIRRQEEKIAAMAAELERLGL